MARQLVSEKIEVNPSVSAPTLFAPQKAAVKITGLIKVGYVKSKVENGHRGDPYLVKLRHR
ncbi:hypothetical protein Z949_4055 [Sulfitobacter guttiformis KCTC 32187]|nr:hypothetical protein Z949_4055 [Sulfitobacter guttiformis KCTC 32187]